MSDYSNFKAQIAEWANRQDWSDTLVSSFVRMGEQKFNSELRVDRMIQFDEAMILSRCAPLPDDWLELDLVRVADCNVPDGYRPIVYRPRHEFFQIPDRFAYKFYTIQGRQIWFGGCPDTINGTIYKITYYGEVPVFSDTQDSWIYTKYPNLYLFAALMHADLHAIGEEQSAINLKQLTEDGIAKLNNEHMKSKASGSRLMRRRRLRSFG